MMRSYLGAKTTPSGRRSYHLKIVENHTFGEHDATSDRHKRRSVPGVLRGEDAAGLQGKERQATTRDGEPI